jgi:hypothetical protein
MFYKNNQFTADFKGNVVDAFNEKHILKGVDRNRYTIRKRNAFQGAIELPQDIGIAEEE